MGDHPMPEIEISVIGNYEVDGGIVTVTYNGRKKSTQLAGSPAEYIAQRLLREILEDPRVDSQVRRDPSVRAAR
jgi:hypothetical protein